MMIKDMKAQACAATGDAMKNNSRVINKIELLKIRLYLFYKKSNRFKIA